MLLYLRLVRKLLSSLFLYESLSYLSLLILSHSFFFCYLLFFFCYYSAIISIYHLCVILILVGNFVGLLDFLSFGIKFVRCKTIFFLIKVYILGLIYMVLGR
jgi:hypothetical protein